jgi:diguanylate cyclase (GGDEF)-like protein
MLLDYNSLLLAIGFAGACLSVTMYCTWLSARSESSLLTWSAGAAMIVASVFAYSGYVQTLAPFLAIVDFVLLMSGFAVVLAAAHQFRRSSMPTRWVLAVTTTEVLAFAALMLSGYDGVAFILYNIAAAAILFAVARQYWLARTEAPTPIAALSTLYSAIGISFVLCAIMLVVEGSLVLGHAPANWAENLNLVVSIAGMSGIGALSLSLNQSRMARNHRRDAMTDPLTGLLNRRALFDRFENVQLDRFTGVLVFDLDQFKSINDRYGHAVGDEVLRRFAAVMCACLRETDTAARLGGEEFAAILPRSTEDRARHVAERIRKELAELVIDTDQGDLQCTVSVGIAFPIKERCSFEQVLSDADKALYRAKHGGRNRIASADFRLAG